VHTIGDQVVVFWDRGLRVASLEDFLPGRLEKWDRCAVEFDGGRKVTATFDANGKAKAVVTAQLITALQAQALTYCQRTTWADVEVITGHARQPGVLEVAVALMSSVSWHTDRFTAFPGVSMRGLISELKSAAPQGLSPTELEIAVGLADSWEQEADELVTVARSIGGSGIIPRTGQRHMANDPFLVG
jgi:hypothetical protein